MKYQLLLLTLVLLSLLVFQNVFAQDVPDYASEFPLPVPTEAQLNEARDCDLQAEPKIISGKQTACQIAQQALKLGKERGDNDPTDEELELVHQLLELNPALLLRLDVISQYFNIGSLVAPPDFTSNPITKLELTYTFSGLSGTNPDYDFTITNADKKPVVSGRAENTSYSGEGSQATPTPKPLAKTVEAEVVQAFGMALNDLLPIQTQFSSIPCWDYYPDWTIKLTFADKTTLTLVTKGSNVVGVGGPWQTEIDGRFYMQYSVSIQEAISDLFEALDIQFGETAAMGCGGMNEPLDDAFPQISNT